MIILRSGIRQLSCLAFLVSPARSGLANTACSGLVESSAPQRESTLKKLSARRVLSQPATTANANRWADAQQKEIIMQRYSCYADTNKGREYITGEIIEIIDLPIMRVIRLRLDDGTYFDAKNCAA